MGVPQNEWFTMENPMKTDNLGLSSILGNLHRGLSGQTGGRSLALVVFQAEWEILFGSLVD